MDSGVDAVRGFAGPSKLEPAAESVGGDPSVPRPAEDSPVEPATANLASLGASRVPAESRVAPMGVRRAALKSRLEAIDSAMLEFAVGSRSGKGVGDGVQSCAPGVVPVFAGVAGGLWSCFSAESDSRSASRAAKPGSW